MVKNALHWEGTQWLERLALASLCNGQQRQMSR